MYQWEENKKIKHVKEKSAGGTTYRKLFRKNSFLLGGRVEKFWNHSESFRGKKQKKLKK